MPKRSELKLTKRTVDALEVEEKDAVFWDRDLAGFGVRVHATGRKVYVVQSRGPGRTEEVSPWAGTGSCRPRGRGNRPPWSSTASSGARIPYAMSLPRRSSPWRDWRSASCASTWRRT